MKRCAQSQQQRRQKERRADNNAIELEMDIREQTIRQGRKNLLTAAAKISSERYTGMSSEHGWLKRFCALVTSIQATEVIEEAPPSFLNRLMTHLIHLLPEAVASPGGASVFIECMEAFEDHEDFILPRSLYEAVDSARELSSSAPVRGHTWKRLKNGDASGIAVASSTPPEDTSPSGLQTIREYLCMNGNDSGECHQRTVTTTLTRALLGTWEGSTTAGRELFDQSVLNQNDRSGSVELGFEVLLQYLVQEDADGIASQIRNAGRCTPLLQPSSTTAGLSKVGDRNNQSSSGDEVDESSDDCLDDFNTSRASHHGRRDRGNAGNQLLQGTTRTCVTIIGNYVRADADTAASFFRDILPKVLLIGGGEGGRIKHRLAAVLRALVNSTRSRTFFNVERMVVHCMKEVKEWCDPSALSSTSYSSSAAEFSDEERSENMAGRSVQNAGSRAKGPGGGAAVQGGGGENKKRRRRRLLLACLDILGPTISCMSLIRQEMVDAEGKANLRCAVADAILEYRRTCNRRDSDALQNVILDPLSTLATDGSISVRLAAVAAIAEACSSDCSRAAPILLERCLDVSAKVRCLAIRLLVDEFRLAGMAGAPLARSVLSPIVERTTQAQESMTQPTNGGRGELVDACAVVEEGMNIVERMLDQYRALEDTDCQRFRMLLSALVASILCESSTDDPDNIPEAAISGAQPSLEIAFESQDDGPACDTGSLYAPCDESTRAIELEDDLDAAPSWEMLRPTATKLSIRIRGFHPQRHDVLDGIIKDIYGSSSSRHAIV